MMSCRCDYIILVYVFVVVILKLLIDELQNVSNKIKLRSKKFFVFSLVLFYWIHTV